MLRGLLATCFRRRARTISCALGILLTVGASVASARGCPPGVWTFVNDSDGATPDAGTAITLTFSGPGVAFAAVGSGRTLTDNGSCSASGNQITLTLPGIGKSVSNSAFTVSGGLLTLPFKVFSEGPGTSTWRQNVAAPGPSSNGSRSADSPAGSKDAGNDTGSNGSNGGGGAGGSGSRSGGGGDGGTAPGGGTGPTGNGGSNTGPGGSAPSPSPQPDGAPPPLGNLTKDNPYAPYVGDWVGDGFSSETRFRQSRKEFVSQLTGGKSDPLAARGYLDGLVMELMVQHHTQFAFSIDSSGHVTGEGGIVYNLVPNLCGLAALTKQANESINLMANLPSIYNFAKKLGTAAIKSYTDEWTATERQVSNSIESLSEDEKLAESTFNQMGESEDTRALALQTIEARCAAGAGYTSFEAVGGVPCSVFTAPEFALSSTARAVSKTSRKILLTKLNKVAAALAQKLNLIEKNEESVCGQVGPSTVDAAIAQMEEKFTVQAGKELAGAGIGGAQAAVAGLAGAAAGDVATGMAGGLSAPLGLVLSIPGVTQVTYWYRGLVDGPNKSPQAERQFTIDGHLDVSGGTPKLYLTMDGLTGGSRQLTIEYMVNYKTDKGQFPAFSPFLTDPGEVHASGPAPVATFHAAGMHRDGVAAWQEYQYEWSAHKVTEPVPPRK